jgi:single-strand DNA-binding protein
MPSLNKVMLIGNLGRDPELRVTPKGTSICTFSLAINREWKNDAGEKQEEVLWVDVEAWGKTGDTIAKYLFKGRSIYVEGRLKLDQWEDKNTKEKRSRMKVVCDTFQFLGENKGAPAVPESKSETPPPEKPKPAKTPVGAAAQNLDEDVPF